MAATATGVKTKSKSPAAAKANGATGEKKFAHYFVTWNGETKINRSVTQAEMAKLIRSMPTEMKAWKPGEYRVTFVCEITKPAAKKTAPKKPAAKKTAAMR